MDVRELLPQNKFDDSNMIKLFALSDDEIEPIIWELLTWLQDFNWPIAPKIVTIIRAHDKLSEPHILSILKGTDEIWKYWILTELLSEWPFRQYPDLLNEINRIATRPTSNEIEEGLDEAAQKLMAGVIKCRA